MKLIDDNLPAAGGDRFAKRCRSAVCRSCQRSGLLPVLDLGDMPLSDGFVVESKLSDVARYPLDVAFCPDCTLLQIIETVPPEVLFCDDYPYYASFSDSWLEHARANALDLIERRRLNETSLVIELASNDGYLLKNFVERGIPVLGIDPAEGPAKAAREIGVTTTVAFFGKELAEQLRAEGTRADVIVANNVLAHVADTNGFVEGIRRLLKDDGVAVIEVPYVKDLVDHNEFDTIYHEHLCYFSVTALDHLFRRHGLYLNDVKRLKSHGGSLRLYVEPRENVSSAVSDLLREEAEIGVSSLPYYEEFATRVNELLNEVRRLVRDIRARGQRVAAYGAPAKGTILLNAAGFTRADIEFAVDRNIHKHDKWIPGVKVPIHPPEEVLNQMPDYLMILPWNLRREILSQQESYRQAGGKFIVPVPWPEVLS